MTPKPNTRSEQLTYGHEIDLTLCFPHDGLSESSTIDQKNINPFSIKISEKIDIQGSTIYQIIIASLIARNEGACYIYASRPVS